MATIQIFYTLFQRIIVYRSLDFYIKGLIGIESPFFRVLSIVSWRLGHRKR